MRTPTKKRENTLFELFGELTRAAQNGNEELTNDIATQISNTLPSLQRAHREELQGRIEAIQEELADGTSLTMLLGKMVKAWAYARDHDL